MNLSMNSNTRNYFLTSERCYFDCQSLPRIVFEFSLYFHFNRAKNGYNDLSSGQRATSG